MINRRFQGDLFGRVRDVFEGVLGKPRALCNGAPKRCLLKDTKAQRVLPLKDAKAQRVLPLKRRRL